MTQTIGRDRDARDESRENPPGVRERDERRSRAALADRGGATRTRERTTAPAPRPRPEPARTTTGSVRGRRNVDTGATRPGAGELAQRIPFVVVVLALIGCGVGGTLWLSAQSTEETYALQAQREQNVRLAEQKSTLESSIERARSAEELAARAQALGMVSVDSAPIVVLGADGTPSLVGEEQAKLGAPIAPLQAAGVPSEPSRAATPGRFAEPTAQPAQDPAPRGAGGAPYPAQAPAEGGATAPAAAPATLGPVPGQLH